MNTIKNIVLPVVAIIVVSALAGFKLARITANQDITECYNYGKVAGQEVKFVGDGMNGGMDLGCFVKRDGKWSRP